MFVPPLHRYSNARGDTKILLQRRKPLVRAGYRDMDGTDDTLQSRGTVEC